MPRTPAFLLPFILIACGTGGAPKSAAPAPETAGVLLPDAPAPPVVGGATPHEETNKDEAPGDGEGASGGGAPAPAAAPPRAMPSMRRTADAHVTIAAVKAQGIDESALRTALERRLEDLAACHEKELMRAPSLEGSASVELSFDAGGVVGVRVSGLGDALLERCLEGALGGMKVERADPGRGSAKVRLLLTRS